MTANQAPHLLGSRSENNRPAAGYTGYSTRIKEQPPLGMYAELIYMFSSGFHCSKSVERHASFPLHTWMEKIGSGLFTTHMPRRRRESDDEEEEASPNSCEPFPARLRKAAMGLRPPLSVKSPRSGRQVAAIAIQGLLFESEANNRCRFTEEDYARQAEDRDMEANDAGKKASKTAANAYAVRAFSRFHEDLDVEPTTFVHACMLSPVEMGTVEGIQ